MVFVAESMWTLNSAPAGRGMVAGVWLHPEVSPACQCRVLISDMAPGVNEEMVSVTYAVRVAWSTVIATGPVALAMLTAGGDWLAQCEVSPAWQCRVSITDTVCSPKFVT